MDPPLHPFHGKQHPSFLPWIDDIVRAQRPERLSVVLTIDEVRQDMAEVESPSRLVVQLLYGSGLLLLEALMLKMKDVDFEHGQLTVATPSASTTG